MLTELLTKKLTHYFNILDYDSNGILDESDFVGVAENICILRDLEKDSRAYTNVMKSYDYQWAGMSMSVLEGAANSVTLDQWLKYADECIVNGTDEEFYSFISNMTGEIITNFDTDRDGYISLMEYVDLFVGYHIAVRYSAKSFHRLDLNKDGFISKEELVEAIGQFFTSNNPEDPGNWLFGFWSQ
jgi:Ca2+-binding EF-hand superfamily protein